MTMADREQMAIDLLCGELQTSWSYCDPSCTSCRFYHEESDMGARVSICVHGFGSSKESCGCYMTQREYLEFVRSGFANLKADNAKLRELVRDMWHFTGEACKKYPRLFDPAAQGGQMVQPNMIDSFEQRMRELGIEVPKQRATQSALPTSSAGCTASS